VKIKNETVLKTIMLNQMKSVMDMVVDEILESLKKNIDKKVYNSFSPSKNGYQRLGDNGGLRDLWEEEEAKIKNGKVIGEVKEKPERLVLNEDLFQHGSRFWYQNDIRDMIAYIVIEGKSGKMEKA